MTDNDVKTICGKIESLHDKILKSKFAEMVTENEMICLVLAVQELNRQKAEIERLQNALFKQEDTMQMIVKGRDTEIDRLKAKYEKLLKRKEQLEVKTSEEIHSLYAEKRTLEAMVEDLHNLIGKEFTCFVGNPHKVEHCPYLEELETAKAEAIKEFAERLKEKKFELNDQNEDIFYAVDITDIDTLAKEMVGDSDV